MVALVILAVTVAAAGLTGCGGDSGKARQYVQQGDKTIVVIDTKSKTLGNDMEKLFNGLYDKISKGETPDVAAFKSSAGEIKAMAHEMIRLAGTAKAELKKVDALKKVPYYKKYADLKIKIIDANVAGLNQLKRFLDESTAMLTAKPFDPTSFQSFVTEFADSIAKEGDQAGKLQEQANSLKKKQNL